MTKIFYILSVVSLIAGILAMFAAKIASSQAGEFFYRTETHWFNDSITALLTSIAFGVLIIIGLMTKHHSK